MRSIALVPLTLLAPLAPADVLHVGPPGSGLLFEDVQAAVDAAAPGDTILVRGGSYPGFVVDGKALAIAADANAVARIEGTVGVLDLAEGELVLIAGIEVVADEEDPALSVSSCAGFVRLSACSFTGGPGRDFATGCLASAGGAGVDVSTSAAIAFERCALSGGFGGGSPVGSCQGGDGGDGLWTDLSSVVLYDCTLTGGRGGYADLYPGKFGGDGGDACHVASWGVFAAGTSFLGGPGGYGFEGGEGGDGLWLDPSSQGQLVDVTHAGGAAGTGDGGANGAPGDATAGGGIFHYHPKQAVRTSAPPFAAQGASAPMTVRGAPGSAVFLWRSSLPAHGYRAVQSGMWLLEERELSGASPSGTIGASGELVVDVPTGDVGAEGAAIEIVQALVRSLDGDVVLSSPVHRLALDCGAILPDCDASGAYDGCEIAADPTLDLDADSVLDACDPPRVWHVDDSAPSGGDGSAGQPFTNILAALQAADSGDIVSVADGIYVGPSNKNLHISHERLVVRSANGPANCTIDLGNSGGAFIIGQSSAGHARFARIEGFTIEEGASVAIAVADGADAVIADCVLRDNTSVAGGAVFVNRSNLRIENSLFERNAATTPGWPGGGAVYVRDSEVEIVGCRFEDNHAREGGVLSIEPGSTRPVRLRACTLLANVATIRGGAFRHQGTGVLSVEGCLVAGSDAPQGGVLAASSGGRTVFSACTLVANSADTGSVLLVATNTHAALFDCLLWDDPATDGTLARVVGTGASLEVAYCDVEGGERAVDVALGSFLEWGAGNLDADPLFVDPDGIDGNPATVADGDWRLSAGSPCIDAASDPLLAPDVFDADSDGLFGEALPFDLRFDTREQDDPSAPDAGVGPKPVADIGAYER